MQHQKNAKAFSNTGEYENQVSRIKGIGEVCICQQRLAAIDVGVPGTETLSLEQVNAELFGAIVEVNKFTLKEHGVCKDNFFEN